MKLRYSFQAYLNARDTNETLNVYVECEAYSALWTHAICIPIIDTTKRGVIGSTASFPEKGVSETRPPDLSKPRYIDSENPRCGPFEAKNQRHD